METDWSSLPGDVLDLIIKHQPIKDQIRFGVVTKLCSSVAARRRHPPSPKLPWIWMTPPQDDSSHPGAGDFFSPSDNQVYRLNMPQEALVGHCCGAHEGWLIMADDSVNKLLFFNPLVSTARFEIQLPDPLVQNYVPCRHPLVVILSSVPTDPECLVLVLLPFEDLWIRRPGKEWSAVELESCSHIILHQGSMYAATFHGDLMLIEGGSGSDGIEAKTAIPTPLEKRSLRFDYRCWRLVESCKGELLMVFFVDDVVDENPPRAVRQVFKANLEKGKWEKVRSLGDDMLLLGPTCTVSMKASDLPGNFQGNCVYSVSDHCIHMFDAKRKKVEMNVEESLDCLFYPKVFFTPSLR